MSPGATVVGTLKVIRIPPDDAGPGTVAAAIALVGLGLGLLALALDLLNQLRVHKLATEWFMKGDLERASQEQFALMERRWVLPTWRASYAASLATSALMAGHAERAIVLLRAIAASKTISPLYERTLRDRTALALLVLNQTSAARALIAEEPRGSNMRIARLFEHAHIEVLIEALHGSLEGAIAAAERALVLYRLPPIQLGNPHVWVQRAYGWLVIGYVWERVARTKPPESRLEAEHRRDEALSQAGGVPPHFYRYLAPVGQDFVTFADRFAAR